MPLELLLTTKNIALSRFPAVSWFKMVIENLKKRSFARKERFSQKERPRFIHKIDS
jgi:hypothetical protein